MDAAAQGVEAEQDACGDGDHQEHRRADRDPEPEGDVVEHRVYLLAAVSVPAPADGPADAQSRSALRDLGAMRR
ncbi:hypothetical protein GCM10027589_49990 [Actinocorallia lasiicapitis]